MLQDLTGIPTVATLPMWWQHGLPEEDGVFDDRSVANGRSRMTVAVIAYPRISNLDEFQPLKNIPGVRLQWVRSPSGVGRAEAYRLDHPAGLQAHQLATWPGCARRGWMPRWRSMRGRVGRCWACAVACRCWARR